MFATALLMSVTVLPMAHAHNDYVQKRPLLGALEQGFGSIEADVFLVNGELLVGHDRPQLTPERTLKKMYLEPLAAQVKANGGTVYGKPSELILLVDIKADGAAVYEQLKKDLQPYHSILTKFDDKGLKRRAITVILSGDRPIDVLKAEKKRWAFIDGRPENIGQDSNLFPLISEDFTKLFKYRGSQKMSEAESQSLTEMVSRTKAAGQKLRFWAAYDSRDMWSELFKHKVDLIGTDRQVELASFLRETISSAGTSGRVTREVNLR